MSATASQPDAVENPAKCRPPRHFDFGRDSFAFANELIWEYRFDAASGRTTFLRRERRPDYAHRCFVLARAARQFLYHAKFEPERPAADEETCRCLIRRVLSRDPRRPGAPGEAILFPGYTGLRQLSAVRERLLKVECGGAWRSYVLRSHWRMVFPIGRAHQARTAGRLVEAIRRGESPIVHLVRFPKLSINHGMVLFQADRAPDGVLFHAYDPNDPENPAQLFFNGTERVFRLPANRYWAGGRLDVIEIYRGWFL